MYLWYNKPTLDYYYCADVHLKQNKNTYALQIHKLHVFKVVYQNFTILPHILF